MRIKPWASLSQEEKMSMSFFRLCRYYWDGPSDNDNPEILFWMSRAVVPFGQWIKQYEKAKGYEDEMMMAMASLQILQRAVNCEQWLKAIAAIRPATPMWEEAVDKAFQTAKKRQQICRLDEFLPASHRLKIKVARMAREARIASAPKIGAYRRKGVEI